MNRDVTSPIIYLVALAAGLGFSPRLPAQSVEPLGEARAVLRLPPAEAVRGLPVVLRGVVTYIKPEGVPDLVLQDETGGVFVNDLPQPPPSGLHPGAFVELRGFTWHVEFSPTVRYESVMVLGKRALPEPIRVNLDDLLSGRFHCQYVEFTGVVRSLQVDSELTPPRLLLKVATPAGALDVWILRFPEAEELRLVDSRIRVRGVCLHWFNRPGQPTPLRLLVNDLQSLTVERVGQPDPFSAPLVPMDGMLQYRPDGLNQHRLRVRGVVTLHQPGESLILQNGPRAVRVRPAVVREAIVGDEVEAAGFVAQEGYTPELQEAVFRVLGHPGPPVAQKIPQAGFPVSLKTGGLDHALVQWQATVTSLRQGDRNLMLQLETDGFQHHVTLDHPRGPLPPGLGRGSRVELVGIAEVRMSERGFVRGMVPELVTFTLRDARDIRVLQAGPWLTVKSLLLALGVGVGTLILSLLWVMTLRQRVNQRTAQVAREIRVRHDAELEFNATLAERNRLGAELHDTLEQSLTGLSLQLQAAELAMEARPAQSRGHLESARRLLDHGWKDLRQSLGRLRADVAPRQDLAAELRELAELMAAGTARQIVVEGSCQPGQVPQLIAHHALRVAQESLTNAVKHGAATNIRITLSYTDGSLVVQVLDDGTGFRPEQVPSFDREHFGIPGMRERVHRLGGTIEIRSAPGKGAVVTVKLPLDNNRNNKSSTPSIE